MVALTRGDQQFVLDWGDWRWLGVGLLACGYEMESDPAGPAVSEQDAMALREFVGQLQTEGGDAAEKWLPSDLPPQFMDFLAGGAFSVVDVN